MRKLRVRKRARYGYTSQNKITLVHGGRPYFDKLLALIGEAKDVIQLQVYIFDDDETGKEITRALIEAAKRDVRVYLMADGYASQSLSKNFIHSLKEAGVHFRFFEPLFRSRNSYFGRRLHHKVIVVDNRLAMAGGINISDHYNDMPGKSGWLDFALFMEGDIVKQLCRVCQKVWQGYLPTETIKPCRELPQPFQLPDGETCALRVRRNDWVSKMKQVSGSYREMFRKSSDQIIMMSGYFLPGRVIRQNMKMALRRGVKIKLILAGISDVRVAKNAERYMYNWVFRNNIELYEYKPCVLHGKVATYDRKWATIGSYNVNDISAYASIELNIDVDNAPFAGMLTDTLEKIIEKDCVLITKTNFDSHNGVFSKILEWLSYWTVRILFFIFTFNFKQRDT